MSSKEETCDPPDQPCVLVVDDDVDLIAFLFSVIVAERLSIVAASDGQQALDLLEHGLRPHVIVLDLMLPRVGGFDLLAHLSADPVFRTIPRIVITGASEYRSVVADAIFEKPFDHNELLATIHQLVAPVRAASQKPVEPPPRDVAHDTPSKATLSMMQAAVNR